jgi:hypothetical protein
MHPHCHLRDVSRIKGVIACEFQARIDRWMNDNAAWIGLLMDEGHNRALIILLRDGARTLSMALGWNGDKSENPYGKISL